MKTHIEYCNLREKSVSVTTNTKYWKQEMKYCCQASYGNTHFATFIGRGMCDEISYLYDKISITLATKLYRKHITRLSLLALLLVLCTSNNTMATNW